MTDAEKSATRTLRTKWGEVHVTALGPGEKPEPTFTVTAGHDDTDEPFTINGIPYRFTLYLAKNAAGKYRATASAYIVRTDQPYGRPTTESARKIIYIDLADVVGRYVEEDPDFVAAGTVATLERAIHYADRDIERIKLELAAAEDKRVTLTNEIREARLKWRVARDTQGEK